ncbi:hypothetical protein [Actinomadura atramentaria]|uniref:hypothetical protein n=1 Tax=Actinomadura atramentaria TaxID=1990 RepID=UPI0003675AB2|nr:hypothetical protein [Actinomadura atramentaria]
MGWTKKDHENEATRLLAKADQYEAAGDKKAHETLVGQVEGHRKLSRESER